jgi:hypothetical protein
MKKTLTLGTLLLGCCLAAVAQTGSTPNQTMPSSTASNSQATTVQGCLSQSSEGDFMLADNSGNNFQLRGDTSQLNSYIGKEVRVKGIAMTNSGSPAGAMSSSTSSSGSSSGAATQFSVSNVQKVADTCATASTNK